MNEWMERRTDEWTDKWMDGWSGWLTATPADKNDGWMNEGRKGGGDGDRIDFVGFEDWTGLGGITSFQNI